MNLSKEDLFHFQCFSCENQWSISQAPVDYKKEWYCPWCGELNYVGGLPQYNIMSFKRDLINILYTSNTSENNGI